MFQGDAADGIVIDPSRGGMIMTKMRVLEAGLVGLMVSATGLCVFDDLKSAQASPSGYAPHGTVTIDGMTVPDIGSLPTSIPTPSTNLN